jgi:hypothetical protein
MQRGDDRRAGRLLDENAGVATFSHPPTQARTDPAAHRALPKKYGRAGFQPGGDSLFALYRRKPALPLPPNNNLFYRTEAVVRPPVRPRSTLSVIYTRSAAFL